MINHYSILAKLRIDFDRIWDEFKNLKQNTNTIQYWTNYAVALEYLLLSVFNSIGFNRYGFKTKEGQDTIPFHPPLTYDAGQAADQLAYNIIKDGVKKSYTDNAVEVVEVEKLVDDRWPKTVMVIRVETFGRAYVIYEEVKQEGGLE